MLFLHYIIHYVKDNVQLASHYCKIINPKRVITDQDAGMAT